MSEKKDKKQELRRQIIEAAKIYSENLSRKSFLYVYGEEYFEVSFPVDCFLHLTGVDTSLSAKNFYSNARKGLLSLKQFYFSKGHLFSNAKKKLPCLKRLPELTNETVCILKDLKTNSITYKLSVSNLEFTLGLLNKIDKNGQLVYRFFLPMSLRVEDSSVERSRDGEIVDFIFSKDASVSKYNVMLVQDKNKKIPDSIRHLLDEKFT